MKSSGLYSNGNMGSVVLVLLTLTVLGGTMSEKVEEWSRCGGVRISSKTHVCCDGVMRPVIPGKPEVCCGNFKIDDLTHLCCGRIVYPKFVDILCCGTEMYSAKSNMCCGGIIYDRLPETRCCRGRLYRKDRQSCRRGRVVQYPIQW